MLGRKRTTAKAVSALGIALMAVAGFVDVVGFLTLTGIYAAHMSGNSVGLAIAMARRDPSKAIIKFCPILTFLPAVMVGVWIVEAGRRANRRCHIAPALLAESLCLVIFIPIAHQAVKGIFTWPVQIILIALAAGAMGIQNGSLRRVAGLESVHTYITGIMVTMGESLADFVLWLLKSLRVRRPGRGRRVLHVSLRHPQLRNALFFMALWLAYISGALVGAVAHHEMAGTAMGVAVVVLLIIAAVDLIRPIHGSASYRGLKTRPSSIS